MHGFPISIHTTLCIDLFFWDDLFCKEHKKPWNMKLLYPDAK